YVAANCARDVVDVVRDRARMSHERIDVAVNLVENVAYLLVAFPKIPRRRNQRYRQHDDGQCQDTTCNAGDLLEPTGLGGDLLHVDRVANNIRGLQEQLAANPSHHVREVCKGEAIYRG